MSDLYLYELEDNVWDEFGESDDHIVPQPGDEYVDQFAVHGDSRKKPRHEVIGVTSTTSNTTKYGYQGKEEKFLPTLTKKDTMLDKGSWSRPPEGVFPASCASDSVKEVTSIASDDTRLSSHGFKSGNIDSVDNEFCAKDPILGDKCTEVDNNLYRFPLNNISQTDNDLSFLDNGCEDKESNELLYYGWPELENFEDVDRMFRSCDSTFELGSLSNEDDLGWFSSSHATQGSEDALKSGSKLKSVSEHLEDFRPNGEGPSINDSNKKGIFMGDKASFRTMDAENANLNHISFINGSDMKAGSKDDPIPHEQINLHKRQPKHQNQSEGKRKDRHLENGGSVHHYGNVKQYADVKRPFGDSSHQVFTPSGLQQHKQNIRADSLRYMQTHVPYMHLDYSHPSDQISVSTISGNKSENNGYPSPSPKESSYASNQVQSMESSHGPLLTTNGRRERLYQHQELPPSSTRNFKHATMASPMVFSDPVLAQKQGHLSEHEMEGHGEVEVGSMGLPAELDTSNAQDSSCVSSVLDGVSLEATSFRQLQRVMEQLDIRTKLCIRDSLYRLAKSAEQRHNCTNPNGGVIDDRDASGAVMAEETNNGFMDMETDTNPIDRSIAHLLFHRPSDPSVMPPTDALSFRSHAMIHGSITSPPGMAEKKVCQEETAASADKSCWQATANNKE